MLNKIYKFTIFIFVLLFVFSLSLIDAKAATSTNTYLTPSANYYGNEIALDNDLAYLQFFYLNYNKVCKNYVLYNYNSYKYFMCFDDDDYQYFRKTSTGLIRPMTEDNIALTRYYYFGSIYSSQFSIGLRASQTNTGFKDGEIVYSSLDVKDMDNNVIFSKNMSVADLEKSLPEIKDTSSPPEINYISEFPLSKEECYVLLVLVGIIVLMLFLKWCYPFRGGKDL